MSWTPVPLEEDELEYYSKEQLPSYPTPSPSSASLFLSRNDGFLIETAPSVSWVAADCTITVKYNQDLQPAKIKPLSASISTP